MNKQKIGITTLYTGFNYGSGLQAYALTEIIKNLGYEPEIFSLKGNVIKGYDIRVGKFLKIFCRALIRPQLFFKTYCQYKDSYEREIIGNTKALFLEFNKSFLPVTQLSYCKMKKLAAQEQYKAFVCGSDQIWNGTSLYVSPLYFLRFAPKNKRIAYAPSFGREAIANYNKKIFKRYISDFKSISIREESGAKLIGQLIGRSCPVVADPALAIGRHFWNRLIKDDKNNGKYILIYFLDQPSLDTIKAIEKIAKEKDLIIKAVGYKHNSFNLFDREVSYCEAGPMEFLSLVKNSQKIFTDSYHGTIFSLLFNKEFVTFERNYKAGGNQSIRIKELLNRFNLINRYCAAERLNFTEKIDYNNINTLIDKFSKESIEYLKNAIEGIR